MYREEYKGRLENNKTWNPAIVPTSVAKGSKNCCNEKGEKNETNEANQAFLVEWLVRGFMTRIWGLWSFDTDPYPRN